MTFTPANLETAMCLWEALQEQLAGGELEQLARAFVEDAGTIAARHTVGSWIEECEAEWQSGRLAGIEDFPYDWEHCPRFVARKLREQFPDMIGQTDAPAPIEVAGVDLKAQIALLWKGLNALDDCNSDMQAEGRETYGPDRDNLCTAITFVSEALGIPTGAETKHLIAA